MFYRQRFSALWLDWPLLLSRKLKVGQGLWTIKTLNLSLPDTRSPGHSDASVHLLSLLAQGRSNCDRRCLKPSEPAAACCQWSLLLQRQKVTIWSLQWPVGLVKLSGVYPLYHIWDTLQKLAVFQYFPGLPVTLWVSAVIWAIWSSPCHSFHTNPRTSRASPVLSSRNNFQLFSGSTFGHSWCVGILSKDIFRLDGRLIPKAICEAQVNGTTQAFLKAGLTLTDHLPWQWPAANNTGCLAGVGCFPDSEWSQLKKNFWNQTRNSAEENQPLS